MNAARFIQGGCGVCLPALVVLWLAGCSKAKTESAPAPPPPVSTAPATSPAPPPVAAAPAIAPDTGLSQAQAALKARDYETAADTLLALQQSRRLTEAQAAATADQMRQLQSALVGAIARGDPKAQAAAEKLRRASMHH